MLILLARFKCSYIFSRGILDEIALEQTNEENPELKFTWVEELLRLLVIVLFVSACRNYNRQGIGSQKPIVVYGVPYCFNHWMSGNRFEMILGT